MYRSLYPRFASVRPVVPNTSIAFLSGSSTPTSATPASAKPTTDKAAVPAPAVPPYRKKSVRVSYEIFDQAYHHGRRKEPKCIFTASYEISDDHSKTDHKDDYCRKCQTTYYKRYASSTPTEDDKAKKSLDIPQRLKYIEAHGEIRRLCTKCRTYFMALMDDVKRAVGKHGKESNR